jgi:predicted DNA-binding transcriptional regulator AlpA
MFAYASGKQELVRQQGGAVGSRERAERPGVTVPVAAARMGFGVNTIYRAVEDGTLPCITFRGGRQISAPLVDFIASAIRSGRSGTVEGLAAEWLAMQRQPVPA